ncbi:hypothetical protein CR513_57661, partial [Mucuna pruriens]
MSKLLNVDVKSLMKKKVLLLLVSFSRSCKPLLNDVTSTLQENERIMRNKNTNDKDHIPFIEEFE